MIAVSVEDTGVGISERDLNKIFNPFYTTKPVGQGTGLGLSICFGIVKEHAGQIWAESQIGVGTQVYVALPIRSLPVTFDAPGEAVPLVEALEQSYRVLVVDDEEPVLRLLTRLLHDLGHQVVAVTSGAAALEAAATQQFDLILTDVKMPEMDGFALVEALRQRDAALAEQVIYITGDTLSALTREQMERGEAIFLVKPFAIGQLEETLQRLLRRRSIGSS